MMYGRYALYGTLAVTLVVALLWWKRDHRESTGRTAEGNQATIIVHPVAGIPKTRFERQIVPTYERAKDLLPLVDASEGKQDVASLTLRARAFEECRILAVSPNFFEGPPESEQAHAEVKSRFVADYLERCADLARVRQPKGADVSLAIQAAEDAGNAWAKAMHYRVETEGLSTADADARLREILASGDPEAVGALADAMADPRPDSAYANLRGDPSVNPYAWQLAACALGRDCSTQGVLMRQLCIFGGICTEASTFEDFLQQNLAPAAFAKVEEQARGVLSAIRTSSN